MLELLTVLIKIIILSYNSTKKIYLVILNSHLIILKVIFEIEFKIISKNKIY